MTHDSRDELELHYPLLAVLAGAESVMAAIGEGISVQDTDFRILYQNAFHRDLFGDHSGEFCYRACHGHDESCEECPVAMTLDDGMVHTIEKVIRHERGPVFVEITASPLRDADGRIIAGIEVVRDITHRVRAEAELRSLKKAIETMQLGVTITDMDGRIVFTNPADADMHGYAVEELIGRDVRIFAPSSTWNKLTKEQIAAMKSRQRESVNIRKDGSTFIVHLLSDLVNDVEGNPEAVVTTCEDITAQKEMEERLRYMSTHDGLTGLYNRAFFDEELSRLAKGRRFPASVLVADVDGLKTVNDIEGHAAGDELLREAALVLLRAFRAEDVVSRVGGDEFAALLPATDEEVAREIMERVRTSLDEHNRAGGGRGISLSLGAATAANGDELAKALILADGRMYQEKLQKGPKRMP